MLKIPMIPFLLLLGVASVAHADGRASAVKKGQKCVTIHGKYAQWNGWPPAERIETTDRKEVYGLISSVEGDDVPQYPLPESLLLVWNSHEEVDGEYLFCLDGGDFSVPYDSRPIRMGWIKSFKPLDSSPQANFIRKLKIAVISVRARSPDSRKLGHAEVSFDFQDGKVSNVKLTEASGDSDLDAAALSDIAKASFPSTPPELKGQTLHVELPLYFPPDD